MTRGTALALTALLIAAVTLGVFWPVLGSEFTNYDDGLYVTENPRVRAGLTAQGALWALSSFYASNWHPLTWLSHMLDWQLFGPSAGGHHLVSLLLHLANALLLLLVLERLTGALWRSAAVALLFAIHPLHVESVAWVAERKDVLSTVFWMLALLAYGGYARSPAVGRYVVVAGLLVLGLAAKPMLVTLPLTLLLLDVWPLERWGTGREGPWRLIREKLPLLPLVVASSVVTFLAQREGGALRTLERIPLAQRLSNAIVSCAAYLGKAVWPGGLAVYYPHPGASLPPWRVLVSALALILVSAAVFRARRSRPWLLVGWLWYLATLLPVIGLVQVGTQAMADRYTYVPLIGVFIMVVWGVESLARSVAGPRRAAALVLGVSLPAFAGLAVAARSQVGFWRNSLTLFEHALRVTEDNAVAHNNLGIALYAQHRVDEAIGQYREALRINPGYANALSNLGLALVESGRFHEALPLCEQAARLRPDAAAVHNTLGLALAGEGRPAEAMAHYREALRLRPDYPAAHSNLGLSLVAQGRGHEAIGEFEEAVRLDPAFAEAQNNLGLALAGEGRLDEALARFTAAVAAMPDYGRAHYNRAVALYRKSDYAAAWEALVLARRNGYEPPPSAVEMLRAKRPEPPR